MLNNNDITNKIDKLVLKFCDTSVQCDSLKSLHDCMESILDDGYNVSLFFKEKNITFFFYLRVLKNKKYSYCKT